MFADEYRRLAAECSLIAENMADPKNKDALMHMSRAWLRLAERSGSTAVVQQQQQQIQPKKE